MADGFLVGRAGGPVATTHLPRRPPGRRYASIRSGVLILAAAVAAVGVIILGVSLVVGLRPLGVTSRSMEPGLPVGCLVVSQEVPATQVQVGAIVTLQRLRGAGPVTSRVVKATALGSGAVEFVLRGDADPRDDPEPYVASTAGAYVMQVPWVGGVVTFFQGKAGPPAGATLALLLLVLLLADPERRKRSRTRSGQSTV